MVDQHSDNHGYNTVNLGLPPVTKTSQIQLKVVAGDFSMKNNVSLDMRSGMAYLYFSSLAFNDKKPFGIGDSTVIIFPVTGCGNEIEQA